VPTSDIEAGEIDLSQINTDIPSYIPHKGNEKLNQFHQKINTAKENIARISLATEKVGDLSHTILQSTANDKEQATSQSMQDTIVATDRIATDTKTLLNQLQQEVKQPDSKTKDSHLPPTNNFVSTVSWLYSANLSRS
jgi:t-SNARE complex subunit (syntaxin)